jgi:hypothetical protein
MNMSSMGSVAFDHKFTVYKINRTADMCTEKVSFTNFSHNFLLMLGPECQMLMMEQ